MRSVPHCDGKPRAHPCWIIFVPRLQVLPDLCDIVPLRLPRPSSVDKLPRSPALPRFCLFEWKNICSLPFKMTCRSTHGPIMHRIPFLALHGVYDAIQGVQYIHFGLRILRHCFVRGVLLLLSAAQKLTQAVSWSVLLGGVWLSCGLPILLTLRMIDLFCCLLDQTLPFSARIWHILSTPPKWASAALRRRDASYGQL